MTVMAKSAASAGRAIRLAEVVAMNATSRGGQFGGHLGALMDSIGGRHSRTLEAGESLFLQGDDLRSVYLLRSGWAFRYQFLEDGRRQILDFILPGDLVGLEAWRGVPYGVEALTPCSWMAVSRERFFAGLRHQPALNMELVEVMASAQLRAFEQLTSIGRRTARERVAHLLLDLARRARVDSACAEAEISMPLMLSHLGDALGLATETVCRCLADLKRTGILSFAAGRLAILDCEGLSQLAGSLVEEGGGSASDRRRRTLVA